MRSVIVASLVISATAFALPPGADPALRKAIAASGDVSTMHKLLRGDYTPEGSPCRDPKLVSKARATSITATLGVLATIRAPSPAFVRELAKGNGQIMYSAIGEEAKDEPNDDADAPRAGTEDRARVLSASLA